MNHCGGTIEEAVLDVGGVQHGAAEPVALRKGKFFQRRASQGAVFSVVVLIQGNSHGTNEFLKGKDVTILLLPLQAAAGFFFFRHRKIELLDVSGQAHIAEHLLQGGEKTLNRLGLSVLDVGKDTAILTVPVGHVIGISNNGARVITDKVLAGTLILVQVGDV